MQQQQNLPKIQDRRQPLFNPYQAPSFKVQLTPDTEQFKKLPFNIAVFTKYGRSIWILHGNQDRCSSFFATLGTIVNKLELSFGRVQNTQKGKQKASEQQISPAKLKCIRQYKTINGKSQRFDMYVLKRKNIMYVCWSNSANKVSYHQLTLLSAIDFLHFQLTSCLTEKVNDILQENQTYDPSVNFGKGRAMQNLLHYATFNGLESIPILFDSIPVLPLTNNSRTAIQNILKNHQEESLQINMLITFNHLVSIHKKKGLDFNIRDLLIFFNLIQTQSSLSKSENWFPICLPGISGHQMVFCYLNFLNQNLVHIMIADQSSIFPFLSQFNKVVKEKLVNVGAIQKITSGIYRDFIQDPSLERMNLTKHFVITYQNPRQMVMSAGQYFGNQLIQSQQGRSKISQDQFKVYLHIYCQLYQHFLQRKNNKKQSLHVQSFYVGESVPKARKESNQKNSNSQSQSPSNNSKTIQNFGKSQVRESYIPKSQYIAECNLQKQFLGGYYSEGTFTIFIIASAIAELQDAKSIISSILKHVREQQSSIFMNKYS